jgi:hypothetical protein
MAPPLPPPNKMEKVQSQSPAKIPQMADPRQDLLASIRGGTTLKKVNSEEMSERNKTEEVGSDALAKALKAMLDNRRIATQGSETEDNDSLADDLDEDDWE